MHVCMAESLCCPPETITTLLMDYTPIQNKKFKNKKVRKIVHLTAGQYLWQVFLLNNFFGQEETFRFDLSYSTNFIKTINNTALLDEAYICIIQLFQGRGRNSRTLKYLYLVMNKLVHFLDS